MKNPLIKRFQNEKRWVNWKLLKMKGKPTKIPYATNGLKASSTDESTWATYDQAKSASENIGIVFRPDRMLLGIDIDHCLVDNKIEHEFKEQIAELIIEADTYTEVSPSGEGLHLFLSLAAPLDLAANKHSPFECYTSGRYFTVTGKSWHREAKEVREVEPEEALKILSIVGYPWNINKGKEVVVHKSTDISTPERSDQGILELMFKSKNGKDIRALYEGDLSGHNNDASVADMALVSHLAFWTRKNPEQMERIWLESPLGNREKTKERADYRVRTITNAIASCTEVYEPQSQKTEIQLRKAGLDLMYVLNDKGKKVFIQNTENIFRILSDHPDFEGRFRYDNFKNVFEIKDKNGWRPLEDNDAVVCQTQISVMFPVFCTVGKMMVYDAIIMVSKENQIDSAMEFVKSIEWDGKKRLDNWLREVYGTPDDEYHRAVASNWLKGLVKRIMEPGCKFDYVLVLEGEQGSRKSTSLHILGADWHVETTMSTESKDFFMQFQGKAIVEFSEGETLSRTEVKRMKAIITMQSDKYRPPYERVSKDFPRRCVFAMTTNQTEYLKDETGNRRWLPVRVQIPQANVEWLKENRNQLFAEAYHRVSVLKETVYEFPKEETEKQQAQRRITDPNAEIIAQWYISLSSEDRKKGITIHQVYAQALGNVYSGKELTKWQEMNIADVLKNHVGLERKQAMDKGVRITKYFDSRDRYKNLTLEDQLDAFVGNTRSSDFGDVVDNF